MKGSKFNNSHQNRSLTIPSQPILELYNKIMRLSRKMYKQYSNNSPYKKKAISLRNPHHPIKHPKSKSLKKQSVMLFGTVPLVRSQVGQLPQVML